jgi:hypothetical protein
MVRARTCEVGEEGQASLGRRHGPTRPRADTCEGPACAPGCAKPLAGPRCQKRRQSFLSSAAARHVHRLRLARGLPGSRGREKARAGRCPVQISSLATPGSGAAPRPFFRTAPLAPLLCEVVGPGCFPKADVRCRWIVRSIKLALAVSACPIRSTSLSSLPCQRFSSDCASRDP